MKINEKYNDQTAISLLINPEDYKASSYYFEFTFANRLIHFNKNGKI